MIGKEDLIKINPEQLEEAAANLANVIEEIAQLTVRIRTIHSTANQYWNEGIGNDVQSYGEKLIGNVKIINETIIPTLKKYVTTMNTLSSAVRNIANNGGVTSINGTTINKM